MIIIAMRMNVLRCHLKALCCLLRMKPFIVHFGILCFTDNRIFILCILGCSYLASSVCIVIRLPTDATLYFVYLFSYFTLHVLGSHKPIIRGVSSCFLYTTVWFMQCLCCSSAFVVKPSQQTSPQAHPDEQHKHCMNQMVVYKKQLETPLMMGL